MRKWANRLKGKKTCENLYSRKPWLSWAHSWRRKPTSSWRRLVSCQKFGRAWTVRGAWCRRQQEEDGRRCWPPWRRSAPSPPWPGPTSCSPSMTRPSSSGQRGKSSQPASSQSRARPRAVGGLGGRGDTDTATTCLTTTGSTGCSGQYQ